MLDKLIEVLLGLWHEMIPFFVIEEYERGIRLRLGKAQLVPLKPGLHFKVPFADKILSSIVTNDTIHIEAVTFTTTDGITITAGATVEFYIEDIYKFLINTNEAITNYHDICRAILASILAEYTWEECKRKTTTTVVKNKIKIQAEQMGIFTDKVTFSDMSISRAYKLYN